MVCQDYKTKPVLNPGCLVGDGCVPLHGGVPEKVT